LAALQGGLVRKWVSPIYQLLCHAIELTLKAYLAASGVPITTLANHIGHDLELAFRCAQKHGFMPSDAGFWEVVQSLAPYHLDHSFRYGKPHGSVTHPEPSKAADEHQGEWPRERLLAMDEKFMARRACACSWSPPRGSVTRDHRYGVDGF